MRDTISYRHVSDVATLEIRGDGDSNVGDPPYVALLSPLLRPPPASLVAEDPIPWYRPTRSSNRPRRSIPRYGIGLRQCFVATVGGSRSVQNSSLSAS
jgi:hypothetical protein